MNKDNGIYILVTPTIKDDSRAEYRVAFLDSNHNLVWDIGENPSDALDPSVVKPIFNKSKVYTDSYEAQEEAERIVDNNYMTTPPVYRVFISTPYVEWGKTTYAKKSIN